MSVGLRLATADPISSPLATLLSFYCWLHESQYAKEVKVANRLIVQADLVQSTRNEPGRTEIALSIPAIIKQWLKVSTIRSRLARSPVSLLLLSTADTGCVDGAGIRPHGLKAA